MAEPGFKPRSLDSWPVLPSTPNPGSSWAIISWDPTHPQGWDRSVITELEDKWPQGARYISTMLTLYSGDYAQSLVSRTYCRGEENSLWTEAAGTSFSANGVVPPTPAENLEILGGIFAWPSGWHLVCGEGAGMLKVWHAQANCLTPKCQAYHWDPGPLGESLNSRYWVGSISLPKRGRNVLMVVDC